MVFHPRRLTRAVSLATMGLAAAGTAPQLAAQSNEALEEITVYGQIGAAQSAINKQRAASDIRSVLDVERAGFFPDQNMAEAIGRMSGVGVVNDQGEGRYVTIRGLGENYNNVFVNGADLPSPEGDSRAIPLDVIPNDIIAEVEVLKTLLPQHDANSLGGAINIKSLSAFDKPDYFYRLTGEGYYNALNETWSPKMNATVSNTFATGDSAEDNFGVAFTVSYFDRDLANDNVETGGGWSQDDNGVVEGTTDLEQRDYLVTRDRLGAGLNLDYKLDNTNLYLRSLYSEFGDTEIRNGTIFEWDDPQLPGAEPGAAVVQKEAKFREETQTISSILLGGETRSGDWTFEYSAGYSKSGEEQGLSTDGGPVFEFDGDINIGLAGTDVLQIVPGAGYNDPANYVLDGVELVTVDFEDEITTFKFDAAKRADLFGTDGEIKFGVKTNLRTKTTNEDVFETDGGTLEGALLSDWSGPVDYTLDPSFSLAIDARAFSAAILPQTGAMELNEEDSAVADTEIDENVYAGYVQLTQNWDRFTLIYGLRAELTDLEAMGFEFFEDAVADTTVVRGTNYSTDYSNFFPSITARWNYSDDVVLRAALTNSMARPTFEQITPGRVRVDNAGDDEFVVAQGNQDLEPLEAVNIDLMAEYYPTQNAVLSAGLFYKDITNFVYEATIDGTGDLDGYEVETFLNADEAYIAGLELNGVYTWDSGFLVNANMTFVDAETTIDFDGGSRDIMLPNQAETVGTIAVGYEKDWLSLRLAANYRSKAFIEAGDLEDSFEDLYEDSNMNVQFSGYANVTDQLQVFLKVQNLIDEPYYAYQSRARYNAQYETYDVAYYVGFEFSNF